MPRFTEEQIAIAQAESSVRDQAKRAGMTPGTWMKVRSAMRAQGIALYDARKANIRAYKAKYLVDGVPLKTRPPEPHPTTRRRSPGHPPPPQGPRGPEGDKIVLEAAVRLLERCRWAWGTEVMVEQLGKDGVGTTRHILHRVLTEEARRFGHVRVLGSGGIFEYAADVGAPDEEEE